MFNKINLYTIPQNSAYLSFIKFILYSFSLSIKELSQVLRKIKTEVSKGWRFLLEKKAFVILNCFKKIIIITCFIKTVSFAKNFTKLNNKFDEIFGLLIIPHTIFSVTFWY